MELSKQLIMRLSTLLSICIFLSACNTPTELLEKGNADQALKKAIRKVKRDKNVLTNTEVVVKSGDQISKNTLSYNKRLVQSFHLKDWTRAQRNYDKTLKELFAANDVVNGKLQRSYDELCTEKIELDFKIADHFYQLGEDLLATHYEQTSKHHAREAYFNYQECLSYGGDRFFQDINDKMDVCIIEGRTFFVSKNFNPSTDIFFQPLPQESQDIPDCVVYADFGYTHFSESSHSSSESFTEKIEVGQGSEVDTAGVTHYFPIYQEVTGTVEITTVIVSAENTSYIEVDNVTGHCFKQSSSFYNSVSDSYQEVSFSGDSRAIPSCYSEGTTGNSFFIRSNLSSSIDSEIDSDIYSW